MTNKKILRDLGLSSHEADAYLALLKVGESSAANLAREMGLKRTSVYAVLQSLSNQGFVENVIYKKKLHYIPAKPEKLASRFEKKLETFRGIIPLLETLEKNTARSFGVRIIETAPELEEFYRDILDEYRGKEYRIIGNAGSWEGIDEDFFVQFRKDRATNHIKTRLLLSFDSKVANPTDTSLLREFRYLPSKYVFESTLDIFDDKILIVNPHMQSLAIIIAVPVVVDIFKSMFDMLWSIDPENPRRP